MVTRVWVVFLVCCLYHHHASCVNEGPIRLANGQLMPRIGMGTFQMTNDSVLEERVIDAIEIGYRHIDTAYVYQNERIIGKALKRVFDDNKVKREDLFITTKVWSTYHKRNSVLNSVILSLNNLGLNYVDLLLVHWPMSYKEGMGWLRPNYNTTPASEIDTDVPLIETWKGMQDALNMGLTKSIGVSNFNSEQLSRLLKQSYIKPVVNQVECNPYMSQEPLVGYCQSRGIAVTAYAPLGRADTEILNDIVLNQIATIRNKTVPQVMLRWLIQRDIIAIPKTSRRERLIENFNVFDFNLTEAEMSSIMSLNKDKRIFTKSESMQNVEWPFRASF